MGSVDWVRGGLRRWKCVLFSGAALGACACGDRHEPAPTKELRDGFDAGPKLPSRSPSPIALENQRPGTTDWVITQGASNHEIEGYASVTSAVSGDTVTLFVNVAWPMSAHWELFRLGYYQGNGGRLVAVGDSIAAAPQTPCPVDGTTGLIECAWQPSASVTIDPTWITGQYLFKLTRDDGFESYVPLVIREASPRAPLLYQSSVSTWQAYNMWGGASLYRNSLPAGAPFQGSRAYRVSFDRPYEYARPAAGKQQVEFGAGHLFLSERWMLQWLEMKGYDLAYLTDIDVDMTPRLLDGRQMFLDVGHDEYWSLGERAALDGARDAGTSLGFFSANTGYWRVRLETSSTGAPDRIVTCYKDASLDPKGKTESATVQFRKPPDAMPEDGVVGQMYETWAHLDAFPLVVGNAKHWLYEGTGAREGDTLPHLVGYEWDHAYADSSEPNVDVVATSNTFDYIGAPSFSNVTVYYPTSTSIVFSAGTIAWAWGLGKPNYSDDRVGRITENVLAHAGLPPDTPTVIQPPAQPTDIGTATKVSLVAGAGVPGYFDGPADVAEFNSPAGVAEDASGNVYVTEARNHLVRLITPDGTVSTLAGCGPSGTRYGHFADGTGAGACFSLPTGITVGPDAIYVSDTFNHRIRRITWDGVVTTYAGNGASDYIDSKTLRSAAIAYPRGLTFGPDGAIYVVSNTAMVRRIATDGVTTVAGGNQELSGVAVGPDGTVYVVATGGGGVSVAKNGAFVPIVNPLGNFGDQAGPGDIAMLRPADGIGIDGNHLVVSDAANYKIRRVSLSPDHAVTTLVGNGLSGTTLGTGATARVVNPRGLAVTLHGYLVADSGNNRILRVQPPSQLILP